MQNLSRRDFIKIASVAGGTFVIGTSLFNSMFAAPNVNIQGLFSTQRLNNGVEMPIFGFGAYSKSLSDDSDKNVQAIFHAIKLGYRHIGVYKTESDVGAALVKSGVHRDEIFVSLQLDGKDIKNEDDFVVAFNESLAKLRTDYVDLFCLFFPKDINKEILNHKINIWKAMETLYKDKRIRALGVTNLTYDVFSQFLPECEIKPAVNQVFSNPYMFDDRLAEDSRNRKMQVATFIPFGFGNDLLLEPVVDKIAKAYNKTPSQVILRWNLQKGYTTLAGSADLELVKEYSDIFNFELSLRDIKAISKLKKPKEKSKEPKKH